jgi:WD40 repeat protein
MTITKLALFFAGMLSCVTNLKLQPLPDQIEKVLSIIEDENEQLNVRADTVVTLIRMRATIATPRLQKLLLARQNYSDELDRTLIGFFKVLPSPKAIPFLLEYQRIAREKGLEMTDKVRTTFIGAIRAGMGSKKVVLRNVRGITENEGETVDATRVIKVDGEEFHSIAFSPDGNTLASGSNKSLKLWNAKCSSGFTTVAVCQATILSVAFSPNGQLLAFGCSDGTVGVWHLSTHKKLLDVQGHLGDTNSVVFSPDSQVLASAGWNKTIKLWELASGKLRSTLKTQEPNVSSLAFSLDGKTLASACQAKIYLWDVLTGTIINTLCEHVGTVACIVFSSDGKTLASAGSDRTIKLWKLSNGSTISTLRGHALSVESIAFSPDGKLLVSSSVDQTVRVWRISDEKAIAVFDEHKLPITTVAISPNGSTVASGSFDNTIQFWEILSKDHPNAKRR